MKLKDILKEGSYNKKGQLKGWKFETDWYEHDLKDLKNRWDQWIKGNEAGWDKSDIKAAQKELKTTIDKWFKKNIK